MKKVKLQKINKKREIAAVKKGEGAEKLRKVRLSQKVSSVPFKTSEAKILLIQTISHSTTGWVVQKHAVAAELSVPRNSKQTSQEFSLITDLPKITRTTKNSINVSP